MAEGTLAGLAICVYALRISYYDAVQVETPDTTLGSVIYLDDELVSMSRLATGSCLAVIVVALLRLLFWWRRSWGGVVLTFMKAGASLMCVWIGFLMCMLASGLEFESALDWATWLCFNTICALEYALARAVFSVHRDYKLFLAFETYVTAMKLEKMNEERKARDQACENGISEEGSNNVKESDLASVREAVSRARQNAQDKKSQSIYGGVSKPRHTASQISPGSSSQTQVVQDFKKMD